MLTDRQQKFYKIICELAFENSEANTEEKKYLSRAINTIDNGKSFRESIDSLRVSLKGVKIHNPEGLTRGGEILLEDLIDTYGENHGSLIESTNKNG